MYVIFALRLPLKRNEIHMVSQMAHAKNLGESFMAHLENLYNILWICVVDYYLDIVCLCAIYVFYCHISHITMLYSIK